MFYGTTIDDLMQMVQRAEDHARTERFSKEDAAEFEMTPAFMYQMANTNLVWVGVA